MDRFTEMHQKEVTKFVIDFASDGTFTRSGIIYLLSAIIREAVSTINVLFSAVISLVQQASDYHTSKEALIGHVSITKDPKHKWSLAPNEPKFDKISDLIKHYQSKRRLLQIRELS